MKAMVTILKRDRLENNSQEQDDLGWSSKEDQSLTAVAAPVQKILQHKD